MSIINTALSLSFLNKKLAIFDLDGTLANTSPLHEEAFSRVLSPYCSNFSYSDIAGLSTRDAVIHIFRLNQLPPPDTSVITSLTKSKQSLVRALISELLKPTQAYTELLQWLHERDISLAVASSASRATGLHTLETLGYLHLFQFLAFSDDVVFAKPNPEIFNLCLRAFSLHPHDALVLEDSPVGLIAAQAARIPAIDVTNPLYNLSH